MRGFTVLAFFCIALVVLAFVRGNYLLGLEGGIAFAIVAAALSLLFANSFTRQGRAAMVRILVVFVLSVPVACFMANPAAFNSDIQYAIDTHADDRNLRAELKQVFTSDAAFADLSISTKHLKIINVTISGELPTRIDLERLHDRITDECQALRTCALRWDVTLRETKQRIQGLDREVFPSVDRKAATEKCGEVGHVIYARNPNEPARSNVAHFNSKPRSIAERGSP